MRAVGHWVHFVSLLVGWAGWTEDSWLLSVRIELMAFSPSFSVQIRRPFVTCLGWGGAGTRDKVIEKGFIQR